MTPSELTPAEHLTDASLMMRADPQHDGMAAKHDGMAARHDGTAARHDGMAARPDGPGVENHGKDRQHGLKASVASSHAVAVWPAGP